MSSLQDCLSHLKPSLVVKMLRHKGLADWICPVDYEQDRPPLVAQCRPGAEVGELANRVEQW